MELIPDNKLKFREKLISFKNEGQQQEVSVCTTKPKKTPKEVYQNQNL